MLTILELLCPIFYLALVFYFVMATANKVVGYYKIHCRGKISATDNCIVLPLLVIRRYDLWNKNLY